MHDDPSFRQDGLPPAHAQPPYATQQPAYSTPQPPYSTPQPTYSTWWPATPPPPSQLPEPRRRKAGLAGRVAAIVVVALLLFGAGSAVGRLTAPTGEAPQPSSAVAAAPGPTSSPASSGAAASPSPDASPAATPAATPLPVGQTPDWSLLDEAYTQLRQNYVDQSALDPNVLDRRVRSAACSTRSTTGATPASSRHRRSSPGTRSCPERSSASASCSTIRPGRSSIARVLPNSPAQEAGLAAGETIIRVDGTSIEGQTIDRDRVEGPRRRGHPRDARRSRLPTAPSGRSR